MTRFGWTVLLIALLVIAGIIGGWYLIMRYHPPAALVAPVAATTPETDLSSSSIYTNGVYGFSIIYPAKDAVSETFSPWRSGAVATGTPLVAFHDADGDVRLGASANAKETKACLKAGPGETAEANLTMGSTTFQGFVRDDMGTDNQERITSYRTLHEDACVAIESFRPLQGADVATSTSIDGIIQSFSFARP